MQLRMKDWPETRAAGWLQIGNMYAAGAKDEVKAMAAFKQALDAASEAERPLLLEKVAPEYRSRLGFPAPQTSASKG